MDNFINDFFDNIMCGNASVITDDNIYRLNQLALSIYSNDNIDNTQVDQLKKIIMICNVLYNRTDMTVLPVEDGVYDLLLVILKQK